MAETFNPNPGDTIWINAYYGPKSATYQSIWPLKKKVLVEISECPELVNLEQCFTNERECYAAAAGKKQKEAMAMLKLANEYSMKACGQEVKS